MPEMEDESSSTFTNLPLLFSKLDIRIESVDGDDAPPPLPQEPVTPPIKESLTYEERAALRRAERERKKSDSSSATDTYAYFMWSVSVCDSVCFV